MWIFSVTLIVLAAAFVGVWRYMYREVCRRDREEEAQQTKMVELDMIWLDKYHDLSRKYVQKVDGALSGLQFRQKTIGLNCKFINGDIRNSDDALNSLDKKITEMGNTDMANDLMGQKNKLFSCVRNMDAVYQSLNVDNQQDIKLLAKLKKENAEQEKEMAHLMKNASEAKPQERKYTRKSFFIAATTNIVSYLMLVGIYLFGQLFNLCVALVLLGGIQCVGNTQGAYACLFSWIASLQNCCMIQSLRAFIDCHCLTTPLAVVFMVLMFILLWITWRHVLRLPVVFVKSFSLMVKVTWQKRIAFEEIAEEQQAILRSMLPGYLLK